MRILPAPGAAGMLRWLALAALLSASCTAVPAPEVDPTPGIGGTWTAVRVGPATAVPMREPRIQFSVGGQIVGVSGCSDFEAPFEIVGNSMGVKQLVSTYTDPACDRSVREVHEALLATLRTAQTIEELGRGRLRISAPDGDMLLLREGRANFDLTPAEADSLARLQAQPWVVVEATGLPGNTALPTMEFAQDESEYADREFAVDGPCGFTGRYRSRGDDRIQLHTFSYEDGDGCSPAGMVLRGRLLEAFARVTHVEFDQLNSRVTLGGQGVEIVLEAADPR